MSNGESALGGLLRRLRRKANLSIKSAAPEVNVNYTYLSKIENGHRQPSQELVTKLCQLYGADPEEIIAKLGSLPPDIRDIVRSHGKEVFEMLRSRYGNKEPS